MRRYHKFFGWKLPGIQSHLVRCLEPSLEMSSQSMRFLQLLGSWAANERNSCEGLLGCLPVFFWGGAEKSLKMLYLKIWVKYDVMRVYRERKRECVCVLKFERPCILAALLRRSMSIYIRYWVVSGPHGTAFINCTCMFEGSYIYLPSTHIYQRHS